MRKVLFAGLAFSGGALLFAPGCLDYMNDCNYNISLACYWDNQGGGTTTSPSCDGDPTKDPLVVRDDCGVFVKPGSVDGNGTAGKPFGTFAEAANAGGGRIFACAGDYAESAAVVFTEDVEVFGGFTGCGTEWKWSDDGRAKIAGPADAIAVSFGGSASAITNVDVTAGDAEKDGGSSIAVLVKGGTVVWVNGELTSGQAMAGAAGESLADDAALNGEIGDPGKSVCDSGATNSGASGKTKSCPDGDMSIAGSGGDGGLLQVPTEAGSGTDGAPAPDPNPNMKGLGGKGEGVNAATECSDGTSGTTGADGTVALPVAGVGEVGESGYQGLAGNAGKPGKPGQGGGGGGGAKGATMVTCNMVTNDRVGASGGAGGTGGCGGKGGGGGGAGGASIVLLSLGADVTLTNVTLHPGTGGAGGMGGKGQSGGQPGGGGAFGAGAGTAKKSCSGGDGGSGGPGGSGSGGAGGHAVGVAFKGTAPKAVVTMDNAAPGVGGDGGPGNEVPGKGSDGQACQTLNFDNGMCQ